MSRIFTVSLLSLMITVCGAQTKINPNTQISGPLLNTNSMIPGVASDGASGIAVTGNVAAGTPIAITSGGTGSNTPTGARASIGAAASGANSDITSLNSIVTIYQPLKFGVLGAAYGYGRAVQITPNIQAAKQQLCADGVGNQVDCGVQVSSSQQAIESSMIANNFYNLQSFSDGTDFFSAAPGYVNDYSDDTTLAMWGMPSAFTAPQIANTVDKFLAVSSNGSGTGGNTLVAGELPMAISQSGAAVTFYSAWDTAHIHASGDGALMLPILESVYIFAKGGPISHFVASAPKLKAALLTVPRDGTTGLVYVTPGAEWVPWGFEEEARKTGFDAMGSVLYWNAAALMAGMYTQAGDSANAAIFTAQASLIATNMGTSSPLWDSANGMYWAASINNKQDDILASSLAVFTGLATAGQKTAIGAWLVAHYATITESHGYVLQTPSSWTTTGYLPNTGGPPYTASSYTAGCYQSGYWSVGNLWIETALRNSSLYFATELANTNALSSDPTQEYYAPSCGVQTQGFTQNLESPIGTTAYIYAHPEMLNTVSRTGLSLLASLPSSSLGFVGYNDCLSLLPASELPCDTSQYTTRWVFNGVSGTTILQGSIPGSTFTWQTLEQSIRSTTLNVSHQFGPQNSVESIGTTGSGIMILGVNSIAPANSTAAESSVDHTNPSARLALTQAGALLVQTAPATSGLLGWTTRNTLDDGAGNAAVAGSQTVGAESSFSGYAACYSTAGKMGHCTSVVAAGGTCTCVTP